MIFNMNDYLQPLSPDQWDDRIQHIAERLGDPLNIHKMIAHHPALMEAYTPIYETDWFVVLERGG
jgi:hypothetical protein